MPEMNGYEATKTIRLAEKATGAHVPIIAMTANAMKGDREQCLASGMDAYVAKPVRSDELFNAIESIIPDSETTTAVHSPTESNTKTEETPFDVAQFRETCGSIDLMRELISIYQEDVPPLLEKLEYGLQADDPEEVHQAAHSLKGLVGNYAAPPAHEAVTTLDNAARSGDIEAARTAFPNVQAAVSDLGKRLTQLLKENTP